MLGRVSRRLLSSSPPPPPPPISQPKGINFGKVLLYPMIPLVGIGAAVHWYCDLRTTKFYHWLSRRVGMPLIRLMDPEDAHRFAVQNAFFSPRDSGEDAPELATEVFGLKFSNPLGLAAGMDKHGEAMEAMLSSGFGFVEVGTVTPAPQAGNARPRVFRLSEDRAVINRYGFNSEGLDAVEPRLRAFMERREKGALWRSGLVGANVGKNKTSALDAADFCSGISSLGPHCDYLVVNVSSPNTPGLRSLQRREALEQLVARVVEVRDKLASARHTPPLLLKVAPDMEESELEDVAAVVMAQGVDGVIVSNTTIARPPYLLSKHRSEAGGLSGEPVRSRADRALALLYQKTRGQVPLVGVGGVSSAEDAYRKIRLGASLVQLYTALSFQGPALVPEIKSQLADLLRRDGFSSVAQAVGADHREAAQERQ